MKILILFVLFATSRDLSAAHCTGQANCTACVNCSKCRHCRPLYRGRGMENFRRAHCGKCAPSLAEI